MASTTVVQKARDTFNRGVTKPIEWRRTQLNNLLRMYEENQAAMMEALHKDLRRSKEEAVLLEIDFLIHDLKNTIYYLDEWTTAESPSKGFINTLDTLKVHKDPYGVVLIIGAWNYPLQLPLLPLSGAIAAGNTAIVKPSELAPACSAWIARTLPKYLDDDAVFVVEGGPLKTQQLLKNKFDYIFYTGGCKIARVVYEAATKHLTPVTLALGGKSPCYIDDIENFEVAVKRILWGKFINAGQTCVAPDYLLCTKAMQDKFINKAREVIREWYGDEPQKSSDLCRIVNDRHFSRLQHLLDSASNKIAIGGNYNARDRFIEPTILENVLPTDKVMEEEILGPIFPIVPVRDYEAAIQFINEREKPLSLYLFTTDDKVRHSFIRKTSSGSICVNDTIVQSAATTLPFGGVGSSGIGAYHGKATFDTFTHKKSCLIKSYELIGESLASGRYPPYTEGNLKFTQGMMGLSHGVCYGLNIFLGKSPGTD